MLNGSPTGLPFFLPDARGCQFPVMANSSVAASAREWMGEDP